MTNSDFITLGADVGGKDAFSATNQHVLALRSLLRQVDSKTSGGVLKEIALVLRVDGSVQAWGKSGVDNISFQKRKAFITADIFVPADVWSAGDAVSIRRFLWDQIMCAIRLVVEYVNRQGISLDGTNLKEALENAGQQYWG
ncbi:hypothetical protein [Pseudomonas indica]|uniref:hypothetical protein n=1 Tax=Pseudomonas indica TaxID=137658 RepID=UPI001140CD44|nr:hypothetical protein [Pseudomonas indica]